MNGLYQKYKIEKTDGSPVAPEAQYFVLRLDTDVNARKAMMTYIQAVNNEENAGLANELSNWLAEIEKQVSSRQQN